jgi:hypothetical protein
MGVGVAGGVMNRGVAAVMRVPVIVHMRRLARVVAALGILITVVGIAGPAGAARPLAGATPAPTDPTSSAPGSSACPAGVIFTSGNSVVPVSHAIGQAAVGGATVTNYGSFTFTGTTMTVAFAYLDSPQVLPALPTIKWSWDSGAWQPLGSLRSASGASGPEWDSASLLTVTLSPGSAHILRFWMAFSTGLPQGTYGIRVFLHSPHCGGVIGSTTFSFFFIVDGTTIVSAPPRQMAPTLSPPSTVDTPASVPAALPAAKAESAASPARWSPPGLLLLGIGLVLTLAWVWLARTWWSTRRRLP